jgi:glycerophosphoryl diester phosphodiesterase
MKNMSWLKEGFFAHRGFHNSQYPENSFAAIKHAIDNGYNVEFDIQLTKDNQLIILHDQNLKRLCNIDIEIKHSNYLDFKDHKINGTNETIPLLTDVLEKIPSNTKLLIELKKSNRNKELVNRFISVMKEHNFTFIAMSFDPRIVQLLKKNKKIIRGYIKSKKVTKSAILNFFIRLIPIIKIIKPDFIMHNITDLPNKKMDKLYKKGLPILSYTARNQAELDMVRSTYTNAVFEGFVPK